MTGQKRNAVSTYHRALIERIARAAVLAAGIAVFVTRSMTGEIANRHEAEAALREARDSLETGWSNARRSCRRADSLAVMEGRRPLEKVESHKNPSGEMSWIQIIKVPVIDHNSRGSARKGCTGM